jgi:hypothetical protein
LLTVLGLEQASRTIFRRLCLMSEGAEPLGVRKIESAFFALSVCNVLIDKLLHSGAAPSVIWQHQADRSQRALAGSQAA